MSWLKKIFPPPAPRVRLNRENLRWNLEERVLNRDSMRYRRNMNLSPDQCGDLLEILNELERRS